MNISLETIDVWEVNGNFTPPSFFLAIPQICEETDVVVVGSYNPSNVVYDWLKAHEVKVERENSRVPFSSECFDVNRCEYPRGGAYAIHPTSMQLNSLSCMAGQKNGSVDKDLFFDHVLAYRLGKPVLPLFDFHDAFFGGELLISGLFSQKILQKFADSMGATFVRKQNPTMI